MGDLTPLPSKPAVTIPAPSQPASPGPAPQTQVIETKSNPWGGPEQRVVKTHQPFRVTDREFEAVPGLARAIADRLRTVNPSGGDLIVYSPGEDENPGTTHTIVSTISREMMHGGRGKVLVVLPHGAEIFASAFPIGANVWIRVPGTFDKETCARVLDDVRKALLAGGRTDLTVGILPDEVMDIGTREDITVIAPMPPAEPEPPKETPAP